MHRNSTRVLSFSISLVTFFTLRNDAVIQHCFSVTLEILAHAHRTQNPFHHVECTYEPVRTVHVCAGRAAANDDDDDDDGREREREVRINDGECPKLFDRVVRIAS